MIPCRRARALLVDSVRGAASEASLLELEAHLDRCPSCRAEHAQLKLLTSLRDVPTPTLDQKAHERILRNLRQAQAEPKTPRWRGWVWPALRRPSTFSLAIVVVVLLFGARLWWNEHRRAAGPQVPGAPVVVADGTLLTMESAGTLSFAGSVVAYSAGTALVVHSSERSLELRRGTVDVEVTPGGPGRYRVLTSNFTVEVVGTRFLVDATSVQTLHGLVRVLNPAGHEYALLHAGERWQLPSASEPRKLDVVSPTPSLPEPLPSTPPQAQPQRKSEHRTTSAMELLRAARRALAHGGLAEARQKLSEARKLVQTSQERAEAAFLTADLLRSEGHSDEALAAYGQVVTGWPAESHAENASFLIGEVLSEKGRADDARKAFESYLQHYPNGAFADEVQARLQQISGPR